MELPARAEFYAQRDSRTNSETETADYQNASFLVAGEREVLETYDGRVLARTVTNLLSRFARDVDLAFPSVAPDTELPSHGHTLAEQCLHQMWAADPHGRFGWANRSNEREYECAIVLGEGDEAIEADTTIHADGSGWIARVARDEHTTVQRVLDDNPIGPTVAACLAVMEGFKSVNGLPDDQLSAEITYDVFQHEVDDQITPGTHPSLQPPLEFGTVQMVGVGSVGSAAVRFLARLPVTGSIQLIDHDVVELVNLNRSPLFEAVHALKRVPKVEMAGEFLKGYDLNVSAHDTTYEGFESEDADPPDVILPLANEQGVRSQIQHNRPPLMLHATTSGADVTVRRNIPIDEACLLCHFPPDSPAVNEPCATAPTLTSGADTDSDDSGDAALPFSSFLAGSFVATELVKLPLDAYPVTKDTARLQTLTDLGKRGVLQFEKNQPDDCVFCTNSSETVHRKRVEGTRFDYLTADET